MDEVKIPDAPAASAPVAMSSGSLPAPSPEAVAKLAESLESAGWVHPDAPAGFTTPGHAQAAAMPAEEVDHLTAIAELATQAKTATPAGVELISDQIVAHVEALKG